MKVTKKKHREFTKHVLSTVSGEHLPTADKCETLTFTDCVQPKSKKRKKTPKSLNSTKSTCAIKNNKICKKQDDESSGVRNMDEYISPEKSEAPTVKKTTEEENSSNEFKDISAIPPAEEKKPGIPIGNHDKIYIINDSNGKDGEVMQGDALPAMSNEVLTKLESCGNLTTCLAGIKGQDGKKKMAKEMNNKGKKQKLQNDGKCLNDGGHSENKRKGKRKKKSSPNNGAKQLKASSTVLITEESTELGSGTHEAILAEPEVFQKPENKCFGCRQMGHKLRDCPKLKEGDRLLVCFACGSTEHQMRNCKHKNQDTLPFATCFVCKKKGHLSSRCPLNANGIYVNGGSCYGCGSTAHIFSKCPERNANNETKGQSVKEVVAFTQSNSRSADSNEDGIETDNEMSKPHLTKCRYFFQ